MANISAETGYRSRPFILHDSARRYNWSAVGSASIKTFWGGMATYRLERGTEQINPGKFLLLNDGQSYEIDINDKAIVESFCVFFPTGMAQRMAKELTMSDNAILDNPYGPIDAQQWTFLDRVYETDSKVMGRLNYIRKNVQMFRSDTLWTEQQVTLLMECILELHTCIIAAVNRIPAARRSTRDELMRRVLIAHEWIRGNYRQNVSLAKISQAAGLSPNHLIRTYKHVFGASPHQHVIDMRLREAAQMLRTRNDLSILAICSAVGFESPSTFSGTFRTKMGISPSGYRQGQQLGDFEEDSSSSLIYSG